MATNTVRVTREDAKFSENILPLFANLTDAFTWNKVSETGVVGTITNSTAQAYAGTRSIEIPIASTSTVTFNSGGTQLQKTVDKTGVYSLSFRLFNTLANPDMTFFVNVFVNGIQLAENSFLTAVNSTSGFVNNTWNTYCQNISLTAGDVVDFDFIAVSGSFTNNLYFDGFKFELNDREINICTDYTPVVDNDSTIAFLLEQTGYASYSDNSYTSGSPLAILDGVDTLFVNRAKTIFDAQIPTDIKTFYCPVELVVGSVIGTFVEGEVITGGTSGATGTLKEIASTKYRITDLTGTYVNAETITGGTSGATAVVSSNKLALVTGRDGDNLDIMIYFKALPSSINAELEIWVDIGGAIGELYKQTFYFRGATEKGIMYTLASAYTRDTWDTNGGQIYVKAVGADFDLYNFNFNFDRSHKAR